MRPFPILLALLLLASLRPGPAWAEDEPSDWSIYSFGEYHIVSDAKRSKLGGLISMFADVEFVLDTIFPVSEMESAEKLTVIAFGDSGKYKNFSPSGRSQLTPGYFYGTERESFIVLNLESDVNRRHLVQHEFVHYWCRKNLPTIPRWLNEGLAEFFGTMVVKGASYEVGRAPPNRVRWLTHVDELIPASELTRYRFWKRGHGDPSVMSVFYAQSWLTVHYMLSLDFQGSLWPYVQRLQHDEDPFVAFRESFQLDDARYDAEMRRHFAENGGRYYHVTIEGAPIFKLDSVRKLRESELNVCFAKICGETGERRVERARKFYGAALKKDPKATDAWIGLGGLAINEKDAKSARAYLEKALLADPSSFEARYRYGEALLLDPPLELEAETALSQALEMEPGNPFALGHYAISLLHSNPEEGRRILERVLSLIPWHEHFAAASIVMQAALGEMESARLELVEFEAWASSEEVEWAEEQLAGLQSESGNSWGSGQ